MIIDDNGLARLAAMAHALRPDWPSKSLLTYLHASHAGRPFRDVAVALAWIAADPATQTPKRLDESGPWWTAAAADSREAPIARGPARMSELRCERCGLVNVEGNAHECARPADPETAARYAELARQAVRHGPDMSRKF
jgi:hypothetical protein